MSPSVEIVQVVADLKALLIGVLSVSAGVQIARTAYDLIARSASQLR